MRNFLINTITSIVLVIFCKIKISAQDNYCGTWACETNTYRVDLLIGESDHHIVYPALLHVKSNLFEGWYYSLLAKKDFLHLYINREKWTKEENFNTNGLPSLISGKLLYSKDLKGNGIMELDRLSFLHENNKIENPKIESDKIPAYLFTTEPLIFRRQQMNPFSDTGFKRLLHPLISPVYFGISRDTLVTSSREIGLHFFKSDDNDILSVNANKQVIAEEYTTSKKMDDETVFLDTGMNHIVLFAEHYGKKRGAHGGVELLTNKNRIPLSFEQEKNRNAVFLIQRILFNDPNTDPWIINRKKYPDIDWDKNRKRNTTSNQKEVIVGEIFTRAADLIFAIWDDALEDGDSISLQINDEWISRGFAVKNKPQFLKVHLTPGPNVITFLADNLGSIPPNTSVLEIIDGTKRKSFHIETDKYQNNKVRIYYEIN